MKVPSLATDDLFTDAGDPNARWIGWGQDAEIPPDFNVFATFTAVAPIAVPAALPLMLSAIGLPRMLGLFRDR